MRQLTSSAVIMLGAIAIGVGSSWLRRTFGSIPFEDRLHKSPFGLTLALLFSIFTIDAELILVLPPPIPQPRETHPTSEPSPKPMSPDLLSHFNPVARANLDY